MDPATVALSLVARAVGSILASGKEIKAKKEAEEYLRRKYGLPSAQWRPGSLYSAYPPNWEPWLTSAAGLIRDILKSEDKEVSDEVRIYCGDLALLLLVVDSSGLRNVGEFRAGETWKSLFEMSRGRGGSFALRLIQGELMEFSREAALVVG